MRASAATLSLGMGVSIPCLVAVISGVFGWDAPMNLYLTLGGASFGIGLVVAAVLDLVLYRAEAESLLRQRNALTDATMISTLERESRLYPTVTAVESDPATIGEELTRLQRTRQFEIAHWQVYYRHLVAAGFAYGWDIRTLTDPTEDTRVTSQGGWNTGTGRLVSAGYLVKDRTGTRPTVSEAEWNAGRLWEQVTCPIGEPPDIAPPPYTKQQTRQQTPAKQMVVDG